MAQAIGASVRSPGVNFTGVAFDRELRRAVVRRFGAMRRGVTFLAVILRAAVDFEGAIRLAGVIRFGVIFLADVFVGAALRLGAIRFAVIFRAPGLLDLARVEDFGVLCEDAEGFAAEGAARRPAAQRAHRVRMRVAVRIVTVWLDYPDSEPFV